MIKKFFKKLNSVCPFKLCPIALCAILLCAFVWASSVIFDVFGISLGKNKEIMIDIPKGTGISGITKILKDEGIIRHKFVFRIYESIGKSRVYQQGGHLVGKNQSYSGIIKKLTSTPEVGVDKIVKVLIPEGFEAWQIAKKLSEEGLVDEKKFLDELDRGKFDFDFIKEIKRTENRLEGYLFPATYEIFVGESEHDIINRMLKAFNARIVPLYEASKTSYSLDEIVTMASLVEREAANDSERGKVASVFYNRIKIGMPLGSCASVQYILKERKDVLSNNDIQIKSAYNTYITKGLPIGPISSVGEASVKAALYPEKTDYLYFAARSDGSENVFTKTHQEHLSTVKRLQGSK